MPAPTFIYSSHPDLAGGGADLRVAKLFNGVAKRMPSKLVRLGGAGGQIDTRPGAIDRLIAGLRGVPPRIAQSWDRKAHRKVAPLWDTPGPFIACTGFSLPYVPRNVLERTILDAHNIEWRVQDQLAHIDASQPRRLAYRGTLSWIRRWEIDVVRRVAAVWAVSEQEADWFSEVGAKQVDLIPNGVDLPPRSSDPIPSAPVLAFVASFNSAFNAEGAEWFRASCWPDIRRSMPGARLLLAGAGSERFTGDGIEGLGFVSDLATVYSQARAVIVPLLSGAGTRLKVLEGLAWERPVISTSIGAEGIEVSDGIDVQLANRADSFTAACLSVLTDDPLAEALRSAGRKLVEARYDWESIGQDAAASLLRMSP